MEKIDAFVQRFAPILLLLIGIAIIAGAGTSYYFYTKYQDSEKLLQSPTELSNKEVQSLIEKVGKLILLPSDETPTVATVSDKTKLQDAFFTRAENGDKVLIYQKAKKAVLYRPADNKIIEVGPVATATEQEVASASSSATLAPATIALYNGTNTVGLTVKAEQAILQKQPEATVVTKANAFSNQYEKTLVIDVTGKKKQEAEAYAKEVKGEVASLPVGEATPSADLLIILGANYVQ